MFHTANCCSIYTVFLSLKTVYRHWGGNFFILFFGCFVCLLTRLLNELWMNVHEILWGVDCLGTRGDLHSDLDPGIMLLFCKFAICRIELLYQVSADDFSDEPNSNIVYRYNMLWTKTYSLKDVCALVTESHSVRWSLFCYLFLDMVHREAELWNDARCPSVCPLRSST